LEQSARFSRSIKNPAELSGAIFRARGGLPARSAGESGKSAFEIGDQIVGVF
jgi:hypothetical protein